ARALYDPVYRYWLRAEWEGLEHVPLEGGALLIANHGGAIPSDAPVVMHGIETELLRPVYGLAENLFRALPVIGTLWSRAGGVPGQARYNRGVVMEESERIRALIQTEIDDMLRHRRSIWRG